MIDINKKITEAMKIYDKVALCVYNIRKIE